MAHINLLPWRERLREERKREFLSIMAGIVIIAAGLIFLVDRYFRSEINTQIARNEFVRSEIKLLDERVLEITELQQQKQEIRERMNVIQNLQGSRPIIVRIFDELVKTLPEGSDNRTSQYNYLNFLISDWMSAIVRAQGCNSFSRCGNTAAALVAAVLSR